MKLRQASFRDGIGWMIEGMRTWRSQPVGLTAQFALMVLGLGMLLGVPTLGPWLVAALMPALSAGWVHTVTPAPDGSMRRAGLLPLLTPLLSPRRNRLLLLGLIYAAGVMGILALVNQWDTGLDAAWDVIQSDASSSATKEDPARDEAVLQAMQTLQLGMLMRAAALVPLALLFWHAPVIIHRENASVGKALFGSAMASVRNLGAFGAYALAWGTADALLSLVLGAGLALLGLQKVAFVIGIPVAMAFTAAFYASLRASVNGCLELDPEEPAKPVL